MGQTILRHLDAHRFPSAGIERAEGDVYLLEADYSVRNVTNPDGTLMMRGGIFGHGERADVEAKTEKMIDNGMMAYRSTKRGDDYFRSGVQNALDSALDADQDVADRVTITIGYNTPEGATEVDNENDPVYQALAELIDGGPWQRDEDTPEGIMAEAPVTSAAIDGMLRVEEIQEHGLGEYDAGEGRAFRYFTVNEMAQ